jgi:general secretion pathway protein D
LLPKAPKLTPKQELYTVVMQNVDVQDMLFALARDARMNVDIHPLIAGRVTMNVRDQTLFEVLDRVAKQVDLRYEVQGRNLSILPDSPYLKHYRVDYPNIQRDANMRTTTSTNVASAGVGGDAGASNGSSSTIENITNNRFWDNLVANVRDLLRETDKVLPEAASAAGTPTSSLPPSNTQPSAAGAGSAAPSTIPASGAASAGSSGSAVGPTAPTNGGRSVFREAASVIAHYETGTLSVRATQAQHARVAEFLDRVMRAARRQVLIEATIVEVDLSTRYQQGIDWSLVASGGTLTDPGIFIRPSGSSSGLATGGLVSGLVRINRSDANVLDGRDLSMALSFLESFGTLRVLSSPKISVLNNQTSVLKVVDNRVYFNITVTPGTPATTTTPATPATYSSTINTVPIGFLMNVTPQVSESGEITLNLRPTISRITGYAMDPNPALAQNNITNRIPEIQTREMESILRVQSGGVAVLGGLMQDSRNNLSDEVPIVNRLPLVGNLFKYKDETSKKTELVIFLRPTVLQDPTLDGDFRDYRQVLQDARDAMDAAPGSARPEFELPFPPRPQ